MPAPLILRIIGDATSYFKTAETTIGVNTKLAASFGKIGPEANVTANAVVAAAVRSMKAQEAQLAGLRSIQTQAVAGSREQIAATVAVADAEARLNRSMGISTVGIGRTGAAARETERDFGKLTRGALAGSGVFSALGRSLAFASGGFLAVAGGAALISKAIKGALDLASTQRQVEAQLKTSGKTWDQYGERIDAVDLKLSHISGFTNQDLLQSFGYLVRVSGNVGEALHLNAVAADVARGRHIALSSASLALAKALGGSDTALRRLGVIIPKNLSTMQALAYVQEKFAGQAQAGATQADRFRAALANTGDIIGTALLPTFDRLVTRAGDWLSTASKSGRIQRDANEAVKIAGDVFHTFGGVLTDAANAYRTLSPIVSGVTGVLGKFGSVVGNANVVTRLVTNGLEVLIGLKIAAAVAGWLGSLSKLSLGWKGVADSAVLASKAEADALALGGGAGVAGLGKGNALAAGAAAGATARGSFLRDAIPVIIVASLIPASKSGQDSLDRAGLGFVGRLPVIGPIYQQEGRLLQALGLKPPAPLTSDTNFRLGRISLVPGTGEALRALNLAGANLPDTASAKQEIAAAQRLNAAAKKSAKVALQVRNAILEIEDARSQLLAASEPNSSDFANVKPFPFSLFGAPGVLTRPSVARQPKDRGPFPGATSIPQLKTFSLNSVENLAQARAALTTSTIDDVTVATEIIARIKRLIDHGRLHGKALIAALQAEDAALGTIQSAAAATKAKAQAAAATYNIPLNLQVSQARLETYGKDTTSVLKQIIAAATRAIASGKKSGAGLIAAYGVVQTAQQQLDTQLASIPLKLQYELAKEQASGSDQTATLKKVKAALERALKKAKGNYEAQIAVLNQIAGVNQQLGSSAASALGDFRQLNIDKIANGLHLTVEQAKKLKSQLSQIGPGGTVPGHGTGAYGFAIGGVQHHHHHFDVSIDGKQVETSVRHHRQRRISQNSSQRRGPNAGMAY